MKYYESITDLQFLDKYLNKINHIFPIDDFLKNKIDAKKIQEYYTDSSLAYKLIHSKKGAVHMAVNYDNDCYREEDFYTQAEEIKKIIHKYNYENILELGCGKGFNSIHLSNDYFFRIQKFTAIDITKKHLRIAKWKSLLNQNLKFEYGDFQSLKYQDNSFDLVFELEAVCHANEPKKVLEEVFRVLKPKGKFILYEGFRNEHFNNLPENLKTSVQLVEKAMAVNEFQTIENWVQMAENVGFKVIEKQDISFAIMPNLARLQKYSRGYFKYPILSKLFLKVLPKNMIMNTIAGLLMPFTVRNNAHFYYYVELEK